MTIDVASSSSSASALASSSSKPLDANYDFAIVGAGVVGSALAFSLARSGRSVCLLERDLTKPDRIVGELLQPGGVRALSHLGLIDCLEGIDAVQVEGYQVFYEEREVPIPYPDEAREEKGKGVKSLSGKVEGRSFHHGNFVEALRKRALAQEGVTTVEATVKDILRDSSGRIVGVAASRKTSSDEKDNSTVNEDLEIKAAVTIVADGCFSKFRKTHGSSIQPMVRSNFVALELTDAPLPAPHHGHVVLSPSGPILLYQISPRHTRILIDVQGEKLPSASKGLLQAHLQEKVVPFLPTAELQACVKAEIDKGQRLRSMPNSFLPPSMQGQKKETRGVIVVGDAMNMRHPLTGGGMSVGLWDVVHLTRALGGEKWRPIDEQSTTTVDLQDWAAISPLLRTWHWQRKSLSSVINILAQALYSLFGADDDSLAILRQGCFEYFALGGECVGGPVGLLSGLRDRPALLVYHFFRVALFSIYCLFTKGGQEVVTDDGSGDSKTASSRPSITQWPFLVWKSIMVFYTACIVILPVIWTEMRANIPSFPAAIEGLATSDRNGPTKKKAMSLASQGIVFASTLALAVYCYSAFGGQAGDASMSGGHGNSNLTGAAAAAIKGWK